MPVVRATSVLGLRRAVPLLSPLDAAFDPGFMPFVSEDTGTTEVDSHDRLWRGAEKRPAHRVCGGWHP